jgi:hypothetical protein
MGPGALTLVGDEEAGGQGSGPPVLHIHAGVWQGDESYVVGNRAGIEALVAAAGACLSSPQEQATATAEVQAADGERSQLVVVRDDDPSARGNRWDRAVLPYTDSEALDCRPAALRPWARDEVITLLFRAPRGQTA